MEVVPATMTVPVICGKGSPLFSFIGRASISVRSMTVFPGFFPPIMPTIPHLHISLFGMPYSVSFSDTNFAVMAMSTWANGDFSK